MTIRVGINGFGRMGRLFLRAAWKNPDFEIVHINECEGGVEAAAHLLLFDSIHGRWDQDVKAVDGHVRIEPLSTAVRAPSASCPTARELSFSSHRSPADIPWATHGVDIVFECTGAFRTRALLQPHYDNGARKVIVAAPVKEAGALNIVMGINDNEYQADKHHLLTAASCTTNCLAPVIKVIHEGLGIVHGQITTIHDLTNTQTVVDAPHKDLRRARASSLSLIPTTTGSATAITLIYPELKGKLNGLAVRVPLLNASLTDCVFEVAQATTVEKVNALFKSASEGSLQGILGYEERPLVSVDFVNDPRSSIIDALSTLVVDGTSVKVLAWYDNEIGYVHRMAELGSMVANAL